MHAYRSAMPQVIDFVPIEPDACVRMLVSACFALRSGESACRACRDACPRDSIEIRDNGFALRADCSGCGQCAAACPSGALDVRGFAAATALPRGNVVRVECGKVPRALAGAHALRVPCLGGMSPSHWLQLAEAAAARRVELVDRGWCAQCAEAAAVTPAHPAQPALAVADAILAEIGWPAERRPRLCRAPLPAPLMPPTIPGERPDSPARRAFFRRFGAEAQKALGDPPPRPDTTPRRLRWHDAPLPERARLLATTRRLAAAGGKTMPAAPFVRIEVGPACSHDRLCARLCPTGALSIYRNETTSGLQFNADTCTACGLCVRRCPQQAIRLWPATCAPPPGPQRLTAIGERLCARCRAPFTADADRTECPACASARRLGSALFGNGTPIADQAVTTALPSGGVHHEQPA